MKYDPLLPSCDLCAITIEEAAKRLGPSFVYDLYVSTAMLLNTRGMLKELGMVTKDNVLSPYVNLYEDNRLNTYEWYLAANNKACGSDGP